MSAKTVRGRLAEIVAWLNVEAVVATTFELHGAFFDENVLPTVLGVDAKSDAARSQQVHQRLGEVRVAVFYDPSSSPRLANLFRYQAVPVPVPGRFFHPKTFVIAGRDGEGRAWVVTTAASANLTLSGWGRNAEVMADAWIHTSTQSAWEDVRKFLEWLRRRYTPGDLEAVDHAIGLLDEMPRRRLFSDDASKPWAHRQRARFYASPNQPGGLAAFLVPPRSHRPTLLRAWSPYWGDVAANMKKFRARSVQLVPSLGSRGATICIGREDAAPLLPMFRTNPSDEGSRFWHMKVVEVHYGASSSLAIGSCNFTRAGLSGSDGNVETMLVFSDAGDWLPNLVEFNPNHLADDPEDDEAPTPALVAVVVAWDWNSRRYRWWYEPGKERELVIAVPNQRVIRPREKTSGSTPGTPPGRAASWTASFTLGGETLKAYGSVVELGLSLSQRKYGRPLTAAEILDSWKGRLPPSGGKPGGPGGVSEGESDDFDDSAETDAFEGLNLYEFYRAVRDLGIRLDERSRDPIALRGLLIGRPGNVYELALLALTARSKASAWLVLRELDGLLRRHDGDDWKEHRLRVRSWCRKAKKELVLELEETESLPARDVLNWFDVALDRGAAK